MEDLRRVILAGDIGGTSTRLAVFHLDGGQWKPLAVHVYSSRAHESLHQIVTERFREGDRPVRRACFGVAGPVRRGRSETPNLPWVVDARRLAEALGLKTVHLINDLEANAYGIAALGPEDFAVLNEGDPEPTGNAALISAGTGLGEAGLRWRDGRHEPFPSEGGHADFAPRNEVEIELLRYLLREFGHASYERVLSGPGLRTISRCLRDTGRGEDTAGVAERMREEDPAAVISEAALEGRCGLCAKAMDLFVSVYGAEAGNLALKVLASGGVFLGGGIAPKILPKLKEPAFLEAFTAKGRMRGLLEAVPVRVILNDQAALLGAARFAALHG
ncbi:MAG: glucokinase [Nitrospinota bacterium]